MKFTGHNRIAVIQIIIKTSKQALISKSKYLRLVLSFDYANLQGKTEKRIIEVLYRPHLSLFHRLSSCPGVPLRRHRGCCPHTPVVHAGPAEMYRSSHRAPALCGLQPPLPSATAPGSTQSSTAHSTDLARRSVHRHPRASMALTTVIQVAAF